MGPMNNLRNFFDRNGVGRVTAPQVQREANIVHSAQMIIGRSANAALLTDTQGIVSYMNQAAEELTGFAAINAEGRQCSDLLRLATLDKRKSIDLPVSQVL